MKFTQAVPLLFSSLVVAVPTILPALVPDKTINNRAATSVCGQYDSVVTGVYTVYQDLWNEDAATSGSQCSTVDSLSDSTIVWSTSWTWAGGEGQVKSYANVALTTTGVQISAISEIPTVWDYSYTGTDIIADVSYDIFTSSTADGDNEFEIMVWLAALGGAGPISSTGSAVATPTINGVTWNLFTGPNGDTTVYSFVAQDEVTAFSGDMLLFFAYLESDYSFSTSQYITTLEAGTEPFSGTDAVMSVSAYSISITSGTSTSAVVAVAAVESSSATQTQAVTTSVTSAATSTKSACKIKSTTLATQAVATQAVATQAVATQAAATTVASGSSTNGTTSSSGSVALYGQCGGENWTGGTTCASGTCTVSNDFYSQCI